MVKAELFILSFMRVLRVFCHNNGYNEQKEKKEIIKRIDDKNGAEMEERIEIFISRRNIDASLTAMIKDLLVSMGITK